VSESHADRPGPADGSARLDDLRRRIDEIDARLISTLAERARAVVEVGRLKRDSGAPAYIPHREQEVLARVLAANPGPLPNRTIEAIYRELMSGSFALEAALRVGYLGPPGSFSHLAAVRQFGSSVEFDDLHTIDEVFEAVAAGRITYGLVPYENSIGGGITDTLDAFQQFEVRVYAETLVEITHCLLANCLPSEITRIYSKPQVFDQCRRWLQRQYPDAELIATASSAAAVQMAAQAGENAQTRKRANAQMGSEEGEGRRGRDAESRAENTSCGSAAIGSALAGEIYGVNLIFEKIEDKPNNITRFLIITGSAGVPPAASRGVPSPGISRTADDAVAGEGPHAATNSGVGTLRTARSTSCKTTLMFATADKPGALVDVLGVFRDAAINLSHIEKRPSGRVNWEYTFFIDCEGHEEEPRVRAAIDEARRHCLSLKVLGSYPRAVRVL